MVNKLYSFIKSNIRFFLLICIVLFMTVMGQTRVCAQEHRDYSTKEILDVIEDIISWKKLSLGIPTESNLFNDTYVTNAGESSSDWYAIGIGRIGYADDYEAYLAVLEDNLKERYQSEFQLDKIKATEWHRVGLSILSLGGDPTDIDGINLIADGTYNRGKTMSLGAQGINAWIWGLLLLDSMRYTVPEDAYDTRDTMIVAILSKQLEDGGFALLDGNGADVDITAMAIQALAPYYNSEQQYTYENEITKKQENKTVRQVVDESLNVLSQLQLEDGDFVSWGAENLESTVQVITALASLRVDSLNDNRFIKSGHTLLDGVMKYHREDGGFIHSETYDEANPESNPDESNSMASEQAMYGLIALCRYQAGMRNLYDFRPEMSEELKDKIKTLENKITELESEKEEVQAAFTLYKEIPIEERCYVRNYTALADRMKELEIENDSEYFSSNMGLNENGNGTVVSLYDNQTKMQTSIIFDEEDAFEVQTLATCNLTSEHYKKVVALKHKLENADNKNDYEQELETLEKLKTKITKIQTKIKKINEEILDKIYPFESIGMKDKKDIEKIIKQFDDLSQYDKEQILHYDDVQKSYVKIKNQIRAMWIGIILFIMGGVIMIILVFRVRKRKIAKKNRYMLEEDEDTDEDDE